MKYPKLSIIVPTYNRAGYLKECLNSIICQNYPNLEIIVTDDNSTDNTEEVVKEYIKKYPYIKYVKNNKYKKGPNGNKNNGLDYATGELIGIFDDDDTLNEGVLLEMAEKILEGYDVVMGNCRIVSDRIDNSYFSGFGLNKSGEINIDDIICGKIRGEFWSIFKRDLISNKRFDDRLYSGEGTLWSVIFRKAKIYYLHKAVRNYRILNQSVSTNLIKNANRSLLNYEKDIEINGEFMVQKCPKWLAQLHKGAAYYAKLSGNYKKMYYHIYKSLTISFNKEALILLLLSFFPNNLIVKLSNIRAKISMFINIKILKNYGK